MGTDGRKSPDGRVTQNVTVTYSHCWLHFDLMALGRCWIEAAFLLGLPSVNRQGQEEAGVQVSTCFGHVAGPGPEVGLGVRL